MNDTQRIMLGISTLLTIMIIASYTVNIGTKQFTGYVVYTEYETWPWNRTHITLCYGHPDTVSYAKFERFSIYGYHQLEYGKLYRITTHSKITQLLKHLEKIELLEP